MKFANAVVSFNNSFVILIDPTEDKQVGLRDVFYRVEPHVNWLSRLRLNVLSMFVAEDLL